MNFKLKALVAAMAMAAAASANAASTPSDATNGSSLIFSAWDANGSYSLDLGTFLNNFIGADVSGGTSSTNSLNPSGSAYTGAVASNGTIADFALTGFNLSSGSWNLVAGDAVSRKRLLTTEVGSLAGTTNAQVSTGNAALGNYIGNGAGGTTATGTLATSTDLWYANAVTWGDKLGDSSNFINSANSLSGVSNLSVIWQQSTSSGNASSLAGFANLTAGGQNVTAQILGAGSNAVLHLAVAAVPEADTYAMFLAGLGLMGFIARRRMQA